MNEERIYTSYYGNMRNLREFTPVAISRGVPYWFAGRLYQRVAPPYELLRKGIGKEEYAAKYLKMLNGLGAATILSDLMSIPRVQGRPVVLLCYESLKKPDEWCHRTMLSDWMNGLLGRDVLMEVSTSSTVIAKTDDSSREDEFQPTLF